MAGYSFVKQIRYETRGFNQPSQKKLGVEKGLSRKNMWRPLLSNAWIPLTYIGDPCGFGRY